MGHSRVGRLMRENRIGVERTRKFKATTDSDHTFNIAPNLLDRDFTAERPHQKWAGDISDFRTRAGWLYLAAILDLHSRCVIGRAASQPHEARLGGPGPEDGQRAAVATQGLHLPRRSGQPRRIQPVVATS
jgi:transposase InsO family protein